MLPLPLLPEAAGQPGCGGGCAGCAATGCAASASA